MALLSASHAGTLICGHPSAYPYSEIGELRRYVSRVRGAGLSNLIVVTCLLVTVLVVGTRDSSIGSDTIAYVRYYDVVRDCRCLVGRYELGFEFLTLLVALTGAPLTVYLSVVAGLLVHCRVSSFRRSEGLSSPQEPTGTVRSQPRIAREYPR